MSQIKFFQKTKALLLAVLFFMFAANFLCAQNTDGRTIIGKVSVGASGAGAAGATISVKGTKNIVSSLDGGDFSIIAKPGDVLVVSFVGYKPKEIKVDEKT